MIIGVDECNFSPSLAGDCVVCSLVALEKVEGVRDSKKLSKRQHLDLFSELQKKSIYSIAIATVNSINAIGIYESRNKAIKSSLLSLDSILKQQGKEGFTINDNVIIDGYWSKKWLDYFSSSFAVNIEGLVRGDDKIYEIGAASIVGRVYADALLEGFGNFYPGYRIEKNHGSPDPKSYAKLYECGPTPIHRTINYAKNWWKKILKDRYEEFINV